MRVTRYRQVLAVPGMTPLLGISLLARAAITADVMALTMYVVLGLDMSYAAAGGVAAGGGVARGDEADQIHFRPASIPGSTSPMIASAASVSASTTMARPSFSALDRSCSAP